MSRHRNVRNMIAEEDYYDDYGDYDDYDDHGAAPMVPASKKKKKKKKEPAGAGAAATQSNSSTPKKKAAASQSSSGGGATAAGDGGTLTVLPAAAGVGAGVGSNSGKATTASTSERVATAAPIRPVPSILLERNSKPSLTAVILGHVDAGKSTLTGQLLWASGSNSSSTGTGGSTSSRRPPQNFAWLLDEDEEERKHGVTMEVATKVLTTEKYEIVLQDAPGHADYVPSMITGTASADAAVVVVDATDFGTSFRAGQLREHLFLAKGLGIQQLIVAINKMDLLAWSEDAYLDMKAQLQSFLKGLGYDAAKIHFCPLSGLTGINVYKAPTEPDLITWYKGPTLWQMLDCLEAPNVGPKLLEKPLRMIVTDVVGEVGKGVAVRARVATGWVSQGESIVILPVQDETTLLKMTRLEQFASHVNAERNKYAMAGELLDLVLQGLDISRVSTGNILGRPGCMPSLSTHFRCKIFILEGLTIPIIRGAQAILHMHYLDVPCHLSDMLQTLKPNGTVLKNHPRILTAKTQAIVEITLHYPIAIEAFADCRTLGRFVLRRGGASIAVGRVEEVF